MVLLEKEINEKNQKKISLENMMSNFDRQIEDGLIAMKAAKSESEAKNI